MKKEPAKPASPRPFIVPAVEKVMGRPFKGPDPKPTSKPKKERRR